MKVNIGNMSLSERLLPPVLSPTPIRKLRESKFFLTINPNFRPKTDEESHERSKDFAFVLDRVFSQPAFPWLFKFGQFDPAYQQDTLVHIKSVDVDCAIELGEKQKRMHAHAIVDVRHESKVTIDPKAVGHMVQSCMNYLAEKKQQRPFFTGKAMWVHVKVLQQKNPVGAMKKYIRKTVVPNKET